MITPVPEINKVDLAFGNIAHLPEWDSIPDLYKFWPGKTPYNEIITNWFYQGLSEKERDSLHPKEGIDKNHALRAIVAILRSYAPKHEHKEAGAAYLLSQWFDIVPAEERLIEEGEGA